MKRVSEINDGDPISPVLVDGTDLVITPRMASGRMPPWVWFTIDHLDGRMWERSSAVMARAAVYWWPVSKCGLRLIADYVRELVLEDARSR